MSTALAASGLTVVRGGRTLAAGLAFAVERGGALQVAGPNGAGKSSLLRVLAGLLPAAGAILRPSTVALLDERAALDGDRPLVEALHFWAGLDGLPDAAGRVVAALGATALDPLAAVPVRLLSTGQRRRAAFARVVAARADLWLLDEPATGLDAAAVIRLEGSIAAHRAAGGVVVVATHQPLALPDAATVTLGDAA